MVISKSELIMACGRGESPTAGEALSALSVRSHFPSRLLHHC